MSKHTILAVACTAVIFFCSHPLPADAKRGNAVYGINEYTEDTAREYLSSRGNDIDVIEGIWQSSDGYKYAIELDVDDNGYRKKDQFRMIVIEGESVWSGGDVRAYISRGSIDGAYSIKYYSITEDLDLVSSSLLLIVENSSLLKITQAYNGSDVVLYRLYTEGASFSSSPAHVGNAWSGTGVAIGGRYLVTNYHIVDGASNLVISGISNVSKTEYDVEVIATDKNNDLAILKVTDRAFGGFDIKYGCKTTTLDVGTSIYVLGYPLVATMGEDIKLTTGVISSRTGYEGDVSQYQMSAAVQPGNSGAPLFDDKGNLIGIVSSKHTLAENSGYAVKLSYLKNLLESLDETISLPSTNSISGYSLPQQVKAISPCVVIVKANTKGRQASGTASSDLASSGNIGPGSFVNEDSRITYFVNEVLGSGVSLYVHAIIVHSNITVLICGCSVGRGGWFNIYEEACLIDSYTGKTYDLLDSGECPLAPQKQWGPCSMVFGLVFEPIPKDCHKIDFFETKGSNWNKKGILLGY